MKRRARRLRLEALERRDLLTGQLVADLFVNGGAKLSSISLKREKELLGWTSETLLTKSAAKTRAGIQALTDDDGVPQFPVMFVNGGKATSHGKVLGEAGRQEIVDFILGGGSYVGSCAGAGLAGDYNRHVLGLWPGTMRWNGRGSQTVDFSGTPIEPFLVAHGIEDAIIRGLPHIGGPRFIEPFPEGTEAWGKIVSASRSLRRTVGTPYIVEWQPTPNSGVMLLQPSHPEYGRGAKVNGISTHTILNAALLDYAASRSQVRGHNVATESLPVAEGEPHDWIIVAAEPIDPPTVEPSQTAVIESERELLFASLADPRPEELAFRPLAPLAVDAVWELVA